MATPDEALVILAKLAEELRCRQTDVEEFDAAYRGKHKLHFASEDFEKYFANRYTKFSDNWCGIVADAPHERLEITGFRLEGQEKGDADLWNTWRKNDADAYSDMAMLDAIIGKRAYSLVWGDADDNPRITFEHPSQAIVGYDPETRARVAGAKIWCDDDTEYATLYLPDSVWKFKRDRIVNGQRQSGLYVTGVSGEGGWLPRQPSSDDTWPIDNPTGKVPLVEWPNRPRLRGEPHSDISGTLAMQHAINLLWAQLFTASDYASYPQRVVLGAEMPTVPILNADGEQVGEEPIDLKAWSVKRAQWIEDPNAKIAEWKAADLEVWTKVVDKAVGHIAAQTRTPAHYVMIGGTIANVPEGGLKALETGLAMRTREKTAAFGRGARDTNEMVALVEGDKAKAEAIQLGVTLWKDVENRSDAQRADSLQKKQAMGYPLEYILELDGVPPQEIERVLAMREKEMSDPAITAALKTLRDPNVPAAPALPVE